MPALRTVAIGAALAAAVGAAGLTTAGVVERAATRPAVSPGPRAEGATTVVGLPYAGVDRSYRLFVPSRLPAGPRPLLLALHSLAKSAGWFEAARHLDLEAARIGALVAYPDGIGHSWDAGTCCGVAARTDVDDVGFLAAVISDVESRVPIDRRRLAIVGSSNGAMMAYRFACERSDLVHVIVSMSGTDVAPVCALAQPVSLLHVHGAADDTVPYAGVASSGLDTSGFPPVRAVVADFARRDGCSGEFDDRPYAGRDDVSVATATGCPGRTAVRLVVSRTLGHTWPTAALGSTYGVDMTAMTWRFVEAQWSRPHRAAAP